MDDATRDDVTILNNLLDDVEEEVNRERDAESAEHEHNAEDEYFELSPDDILRQLDAVTLSTDVEDDADAAEDVVASEDVGAAFEDAHDGTGDNASPIAELERETPELIAERGTFAGDVGSIVNDGLDIAEPSQHDLGHQAEEPHVIDSPQHSKPHETELRTIALSQDVKPRQAELHTTDSPQNDNDKLHQADLHATDISQDGMPSLAGLDAADPSQDDKLSSIDVHTVGSSQDDMLSQADVRIADFSPDDAPLQAELHSVDPSGDIAPSSTKVHSDDSDGNMPGHTTDGVIAGKASGLDGLEKPGSIQSDAFVNEITPENDLPGNDEVSRQTGNADAAEPNALKKDNAMFECSADITRVSGFDDGELGDSVSAGTGIAETSNESEVLNADESASVCDTVIKEELQGTVDTATLDGGIPTEVKQDIETAISVNATCDERNVKEEDNEPLIQTQAHQIEGVISSAAQQCAEPTEANTGQLDNTHADERGNTTGTEKQVDLDVAENEDKSLLSASGSAETAPTGSISEDTSGPGILIEAQDELCVMPSPAPSSLPIVIGTMNPENVEGDEDSDSEDENEHSEDQTSFPLQLNLDHVDDDEDELEIDHAVVSSIEIQKEERTANKVNVPKDGNDHNDHENWLLAALPGIKSTTTAEEIELSFGEEVRTANVVIPPSNFEMPVKSSMPCDASEDSTEKAFGIGYTSLKKKREEQNDSGGYAVPSGPAFPDEREFENELELSSDLQFSVKVSADSKDQAGDDADDEFGPVPTVQPDEVLPDNLIARRASLTSPKVQDEESIINELKKATMEEKNIINSTSEAGESGDAGTSNPADHETESALSLKELHGIYKRGLGDQGVLMLDENEQDPSEAGARLSVMGRILSTKSVLTEAISEEDEGDDGEKEAQGDLHGVNRDRETLIDCTAAREDDENSAAAEDWKEIQLTQRVSTTDSSLVKQEAKRTSHEANDICNSRPAASSRISYNEAFQYFSEAEEFLLQRDKIVPEENESGRSCFACFSRPRLAFPGALDERDRVFCIAATSYEPTNAIFTRILQTLYAKLTKTQRDVPLSGTHWEDIGFQGSDPSTDLRGCGVLSLLQMMYLVEKHPELAFRFHSLSQHPTRHFPLACALINVTLQCIMALRNGALYKECNKHASVFKGINSFYVALASDLMEEIQTSTDEIPVIIKNVLDDGRSNPDRIIEQFSKGDSQGAPSVSSPQKSQVNGESTTNIEFTEIALQSAAGEDD